MCPQTLLYSNKSWLCNLQVILLLNVAASFFDVSNFFLCKEFARKQFISSVKWVHKKPVLFDTDTDKLWDFEKLHFRHVRVFKTYKPSQHTRTQDMNFDVQGRLQIVRRFRAEFYIKIKVHQYAYIIKATEGNACDCCKPRCWLLWLLSQCENNWHYS